MRFEALPCWVKKVMVKCKVGIVDDDGGRNRTEKAT
jgi:hypothetical protein